jgi:hypothetical protein
MEHLKEKRIDTSLPSSRIPMLLPGYASIVVFMQYKVTSSNINYRFIHENTVSGAVFY